MLKSQWPRFAKLRHTAFTEGVGEAIAYLTTLAATMGTSAS
ncbi:hypothetical protein [Nostoc sp.]